MAFNAAVVGIYMLNDKNKMKQAVHPMGTGMVGGIFWGIFIGMLALFLLITQLIEDKALEKLNSLKNDQIKVSSWILVQLILIKATIENVFR
jgi:uncharacterized membrane protein